MSDYRSDGDWYESRNKLCSDMIFLTQYDEVIKLDQRVPGDATKWYVADLDEKGWSYWGNTIETSELKQHLSQGK